MAGELCSNPFAKAGLDHLDDLTACVLKRGRNGNGYKIGYHAQLNGFDRSFRYELAAKQYEFIRDLVDAPLPAEICVEAIAHVIDCGHNAGQVRLTGVSHEPIV